MKLFVIGANGRTGTQIVTTALARGHEVTAFVRSPRSLRASAAPKIVIGDPRRAETYAAALPGHDAVLSAIGPHFRDAARPSTLLADCARAATEAAARAGVSRFAIVSAALLFSEKGLAFALFKRMLQHHVRDLRAAEAIVTASGLDWTIARPPRLTAGPDAAYRTERDALPRGSNTATFRAVATFLVDAVERRSHVKDVVGLVS